MGSKKKKQEKKKDFVKPKLKVGKTAPKASNYTDTSFKSKTINLPHQVLGTKDIQAYISLTKHHSATTRKEVLSLIEKNLHNDESKVDSQVYRQLITALLPLITDESLEVRKALLQVIKTLLARNPSLVELNLNSIILVILSSMNHLNPSIRNYSVHFLKVVLEHFPDSLVKLYYTKILNGFFNLLNWSKITGNNSRTLNTVTKSHLVTHLRALAQYLTEALFNDENKSSQVQYHPLTPLYLFPGMPNAYNSLNLFSGIDQLSTDLVTRRDLFITDFKPLIMTNVTPLLKEEEEVFRIAKSLIDLISDIK